MPNLTAADNGDHLCGKFLFTWLWLVVIWWCLFVLSFFPRDVLYEILDLIESVSEGFPTSSWIFFSLVFREKKTWYFMWGRSLTWSRLLINSLFGVFYSYFWAGDSCFPKNFFKFTLWDSYFLSRLRSRSETYVLLFLRRRRRRRKLFYV